jgi:predicted DCC family thiol-disulfide oxidoreductase YuxK
MNKNSSVIVFDGVCHLCNGWVQFLLKRDKTERFQFAAMQTAAGRHLLEEHGLDPDTPISFLLLDSHKPYTDSTAILRILTQLGGIWKASAVVLSCVPRVLRDPLYRFIARHRYRIFGRHDQCMVPAPELRGRFLS